MKRKAFIHLQSQIKNSKDNQSKEKDPNISGDISVGLSFIEDSASENNLLDKLPSKSMIEVLDINISITNNREFSTSKENADKSEEKFQNKTDFIVRSLFKKIHQI